MYHAICKEDFDERVYNYMLNKLDRNSSILKDEQRLLEDLGLDPYPLVWVWVDNWRPNCIWLSPIEEIRIVDNVMFIRDQLIGQSPYCVLYEEDKMAPTKEGFIRCYPNATMGGIDG